MKLKNLCLRRTNVSTPLNFFLLQRTMTKLRLEFFQGELLESVYESQTVNTSIWLKENNYLINSLNGRATSIEFLLVSSFRCQPLRLDIGGSEDAWRESSMKSFLICFISSMEYLLKLWWQGIHVKFLLFSSFLHYLLCLRSMTHFKGQRQIATSKVLFHWIMFWLFFSIPDNWNHIPIFST